MLLVMTLMWSIMDLMVMEDITSVKLMLKLLMMDTLKDIPMVLSAMTRRTNSVTRSPSHRSTRSARRLWTPPTSRSVRRLCTLIVKKNKEVHHSSHVVGHDSHVEHYGHSGHGGHY